MPETFTHNGNHAQCLAYRALCAPITEKRRALRLAKKLAPPIAPKPWKRPITNREFERRKQLARIATRMRRP